MTDIFVFKRESFKELPAQETSEDLSELQRTDEDQTRTLERLEVRGTESSLPEGWPSSQEQVSQTERSRELEGPETWMDMEDKMRDDDEDDDDERGGPLKEDGDGSLADDEDEDDDDDGDTLQQTWMSEKARQFFTPTVTIVKPTGDQEDLNESSMVREEIEMQKVPPHPQNLHLSPAEHFHPQWIDDLDKPRESFCGEVVRLFVFGTAAAVIFPFLTWGGYELLPFDPPPLSSAPLRLLYTLRCAFFASIPIVLGVLVQGVCRLKFGSLKPLFDGTWKNREVSVHGLYVRDSLHLYLLYFLQLAVMATYAHQEWLKLVPLLTVIFVLGRLIYWVSVVFGSSVRALGFGLSFLPLLALLGANLYFIFSAEGQKVVFDVAPPTTTPPPKLRWWG